MNHNIEFFEGHKKQNLIENRVKRNIFSRQRFNPPIEFKQKWVLGTLIAPGLHHFCSEKPCRRAKDYLAFEQNISFTVRNRRKLFNTIFQTSFFAYNRSILISNRFIGKLIRNQGKSDLNFIGWLSWVSQNETNYWKYFVKNLLS